VWHEQQLKKEIKSRNHSTVPISATLHNVFADAVSICKACCLCTIKVTNGHSLLNLDVIFNYWHYLYNISQYQHLEQPQNLTSSFLCGLHLLKLPPFYGHYERIQDNLH